MNFQVFVSVGIVRVLDFQELLLSGFRDRFEKKFFISPTMNEAQIGKKQSSEISLFKNTISVAPFICKWSDAHLKQQRFNTQKELELHVDNDHKDFTKLEVLHQGRIYLCTWEGCKKQQSNIIKLKGANDMTNIINCGDEEMLYEEVEKQRIANKDDNNLPMSYADAVKKSPHKTLDDIFPKVNENKIVYGKFGSGYDLENENQDDLPDAPKEIEYKTERERDQEMFDSYCECHKGSKAVELLTKAFEVLENGI
ncbi:14937_t:CDS:2 [Funneliformis geosporum]|uniref:17744_t:CDS:1 n=1 Tax=Funneliformis geosporum TaxID=1117311 RepID=A0A9W4WN55_9GLOM|nr:17744_t:CDS:2 [Funneliformis geosporum]CAI2174751.1 14937_t:CDS:2 [Funneliformis geosporum]